jgi:hypothetical protein
MFRMLYSFFWVILRHLNFMCRRFETLCRFHLHMWCVQEFPLFTPPMNMDPIVFRNVGTYNSDARESPKGKNTTKLNSLHNIDSSWPDCESVSTSVFPNKLLATQTLLVLTVPNIHSSTSHYTTQPMQPIQHYQIDHVPTKCPLNVVVVCIGLL